jgi:hypothetical protein
LPPRAAREEIMSENAQHVIAITPVGSDPTYIRRSV